MKHFNLAFISLFVALVLGAINGYVSQHSLLDALFAMNSILILSALETSQSMDNSIIAAKILKDFSPKWQNRYKTWGFLIAVLGMRFLMPVLLVSAITKISPIASIVMAFHEPQKYAQTILSSEPKIMSFGGAFLLMLSSYSLFNHEKDTHWLKVEEYLSKMSNSTFATYTLSLLTTGFVLLLTCFYAKAEEKMGIFVSGVAGLIAFALVKLLGVLVGEPGSKKGGSALGAFIYLEAIDASFSFDGVISSFAVSTNLINNMLGLGVGAMVVRCLTLANVKSGFMAELPYLENGAYASIFILSLLMYLKDVGLNVPDFITGTLGLFIIGLSFISSVRAAKS